MNDKLNFGDLYKFLASVGLLLIILAFVIPFFVFKEDFGLYLDAEKFNNLNEIAKKMLINKSSHVLYFQEHFYCFFYSLLVIGIIILVFGIYKWNLRQIKLDEILSHKEEKLRNASQKQQEERRESKVNEDKFVTTTTQTTVKQYESIEGLVEQLFRDSRNPNYKILTSQILREHFLIDIVLKANDELRFDKIIEVRYFSTLSVKPDLNSILSGLMAKISAYKLDIKMNSIPVLLIICDSASNKEVINSIHEEIRNFKYDNWDGWGLQCKIMQKGELHPHSLDSILIN